MGQLFQKTLPSLTIALGQTSSNALPWKETGYDIEALTVASPGTLPDTVHWEVSLDDGVTYQTVYDTTDTAIKVPAAAHTIIYNGVFTGITHIKLVAGGAVAADRVFKLIGSWRGDS